MDHSENNIEVPGNYIFRDWTMKTKTFTGNAQLNLSLGMIL